MKITRVQYYATYQTSSINLVITQACGSRGGRVYSGICLSVRLSVFPIAKLDMDMFHHESWKPSASVSFCTHFVPSSSLQL